MKKPSPQQIFKKFLKEFGEQNWWPVTDNGAIKPAYKKRKTLTEKQKLEICIGAILTQNTNWKNTEKAMVELNKAGMTDAEKIANASGKTIARLIKPSGYFNQKARKLKIFCRHVEKNYGGKIGSLLEKPLDELRAELLSLHGIGPETADSILLYAAQKPSFVADAYARRFVERYYGKTNPGYVDVKVFFESSLPRNAETLGEMHALLVEFAKQHCRKKPLCQKCFLNNNCKYFQNQKNK